MVEVRRLTSWLRKSRRAIKNTCKTVQKQIVNSLHSLNINRNFCPFTFETHFPNLVFPFSKITVNYFSMSVMSFFGKMLSHLISSFIKKIPQRQTEISHEHGFKIK